MAEGAATATSSAGEDKGNALWNILPSFDPTTDNAKEYTDKVKFLRGICPVAQRAMLAPRLALLCKGTAWSQVKTIAPEKFTSPEDGVKNLLKALEVWQESEELQTYDQFEKAFYKVSQKGDESVVSFVNRLNVAFNEVGDETTVKQVKAFVLLRQSNLSPEDKRRVISMADGYDAHKVETAMRSLAAKVLGGNEGTESKIYPVNYVEDETEEIYYIHDEEMDDDQALAVLLEEGDESALVVSEFEDQIIQVCQDSPELSMAFSAYQEARAKLRDKARNRGFWPLRPSSKGKGKGKKGKIFGKRRQSLAERIASSNCRHCGARGHWKDECPARNKSSSTADANVMFYDEVQDDGAGELVCALPDGTYFAQWQVRKVTAHKHCSSLLPSHFMQPRMRMMQLKRLNQRQLPVQCSIQVVEQLHLALAMSSSMQKPIQGGMSSIKSYVTQMDIPLTGPVDPAMEVAVGLQEPEVKHPPGVKTLRQWDMIKFPEGSLLRGVSHGPKKYALYMMNHTKLVSPWALSFQSYAMMVSKLEKEIQRKKEQQEKEIEAYVRQVVSESP
eukprot:s2038_g10.t2